MKIATLICILLLSVSCKQEPSVYANLTIKEGTPQSLVSLVKTELATRGIGLSEKENGTVIFLHTEDNKIFLGCGEKSGEKLVPLYTTVEILGNEQQPDTVIVQKLVTKFLMQRGIKPA